MADGKHFQTPKRRLIFERHSFADSKQRHKRQITDHYFNHSVSLLIPGCPVDRITQCMQDYTPMQDGFCIKVLPVHIFIEKEFIDQFIKQGHFYALSRKTKIDTGNCIAVLPTGTLILSLDKDTYEVLGLTGQQSVFQKKLRFNVEVDLKSPSFEAGRKHYDRVKWCLKNRLDLEFEFLLSWVDKDNRSDVKVVHSYFSNYKGNQMKNREDVKCLQNLKTPVINPQVTRLSDDDSDIGCDAAAFYEWLGCTQCDVDCSTGAPDSYTSTLTCPEPSVVSKEMFKCQWTGLITPQGILNLLEAARSFFKSPSPKPPWIALNVWGFADVPVTWLKNEHGFHYGGDNMYTFIIFPDDSYWLYMALGTHDICS